MPDNSEYISQVQQIQEAIESGDPVEITVRVVQLLCMLFGMTAQCFTGDTLVATEEGLKPIKEVEAGDYVWSENTETGEKELRKVLAVSVTETVELVHIFVGEEEIRTTEYHPFYVEGEGWKAAGELEAGDVLRSEDGQIRTVGKVEAERLSEAVKVYNLEIEGSHVYYVSSAGVLVHNECSWNKGSFDSEQESLEWHYSKHGAEVNATSWEQYLRKAQEFARTCKKGSKKRKVEGGVEGVFRYLENGKYIDLAPDGTIVSFGKQ